MSYRRKAAAGKTLSITQQLGRLCNAVAGPISFQVHNSIALLEQMKEFQRPLYDKFSKEATQQNFYPARVVSEGLCPNSYLFTVPLPKHFIDPGDRAEDFQPRTFYHITSIDHPDKLCGRGGRVYAPRCGLSGLFFTREEVVDNLQAAATDLGFTSPFWLRADHPGLQSGFLTVRDGSESICISLTAGVISVDDVVGFMGELLHPSLRAIVSAKGGAVKASSAVPLGTNAMSGQVTANPYVHRMPNRGLWISHEQLLLHNLSADTAKASSTAATAVVNELFPMVEVEQWELYNADQLTVPGRLGLRRAASFAESQQVFQPV